MPHDGGADAGFQIICDVLCGVDGVVAQGPCDAGAIQAGRRSERLRGGRREQIDAERGEGDDDAPREDASEDKLRVVGEAFAVRVEPCQEDRGERIKKARSREKEVDEPETGQHLEEAEEHGGGSRDGAAGQGTVFGA